MRMRCRRMAGIALVLAMSTTLAYAASDEVDDSGWDLPPEPTFATPRGTQAIRERMLNTEGQVTPMRAPSSADVSAQKHWWEFWKRANDTTSDGKPNPLTHEEAFLNVGPQRGDGKAVTYPLVRVPVAIKLENGTVIPPGIYVGAMETPAQLTLMRQNVRVAYLPMHMPTESENQRLGLVPIADTTAASPLVEPRGGGAPVPEVTVRMVDETHAVVVHNNQNTVRVSLPLDVVAWQRVYSATPADKKNVRPKAER